MVIFVKFFRRVSGVTEHRETKSTFGGISMGSLYLWIKFIHVVAGFTFIMGHGVSVALAFRI
jgi:hypothetical protein